MVSVEVAGPVLPASLVIASRKFVSMAGYLFEKCVVPLGTGGFITEGISKMIDYIRSPDYNLFMSYRESDAPCLSINPLHPISRLFSLKCFSSL